MVITTEDFIDETDINATVFTVRMFYDSIFIYENEINYCGLASLFIRGLFCAFCVNIAYPHKVLYDISKLYLGLVWNNFSQILLSSLKTNYEFLHTGIQNSAHSETPTEYVILHSLISY